MRAPPAIPVNPPAPSNAPPPAVVATLTLAQARRLLWRAGFGPTPGQAEALAGQPVEAVIHSLTRPSGPAVLHGPAPTDSEGNALAPADEWGQDHCWWLDRMVRSDQQLIERMTFIWHDSFANSNEKVNDQQRMLDQNELFREMCLGKFDDLFMAVTHDPAMLVFLDGIYNTKWDPNENYGREMMELFSLGADRGAYTETDVREMARALTGWNAEWTESAGLQNFRFENSRHDTGNKTVFGQKGKWGWEDAVRLCVSHPLHASFFVSKMWSYFVPTPPDEATLASLQGLYIGSGFSIRAVVEAILAHPTFLNGPELLTPGRLQRGPAARDRAADRHDRLGLALRGRRTAAVLPAQRRRLGLHTLAGHLDREGAVGNRQLRDGQDLSEPLARQRRNGIQRDRGTGRGLRKRDRLLGRAGALRRIPAGDRRIRPGLFQRPDRREMATQSVPRDAPERAAHADRHVPRRAGS